MLCLFNQQSAACQIFYDLIFAFVNYAGVLTQWAEACWESSVKWFNETTTSFTLPPPADTVEGPGKLERRLKGLGFVEVWRCLQSPWSTHDLNGWKQQQLLIKQTEHTCRQAELLRYQTLCSRKQLFWIFPDVSVDGCNLQQLCFFNPPLVKALITHNEINDYLTKIPSLSWRNSVFYLPSLIQAQREICWKLELLYILGGFVGTCWDWMDGSSPHQNKLYSHLSHCYCWLLSLLFSICHFETLCLIPDAVLPASVLCCY